MIIRRKIEHGFTVVPRAAFEDTRISYEARGLLGYVLVKPNNWRVHVADLARNAGDRVGEDGTVKQGCGRERVYRILAELRAAGYLSHSQERGPDGRLLEGEYVITDAPAPTVYDQPQSGNPDTAEPDAVEPDAGNQDAYIRTNATDNERDQKASADAAAQPPGGPDGPEAQEALEPGSGAQTGEEPEDPHPTIPEMVEALAAARGYPIANFPRHVRAAKRLIALGYGPREVERTVHYIRGAAPYLDGQPLSMETITKYIGLAIPNRAVPPAPARIPDWVSEGAEG